jgi:hypothetical protein
LRGESGRDLAEVIRDSDGRVDIGKSKVCIDISCKCEFWTDIEDPIFSSFSEQHLLTRGTAYLPRETEAGNADLEERDWTRTDGAREVSNDAEQRVDVAIQPCTFTPRRHIISQPRQM